MYRILFRVLAFLLLAGFVSAGLLLNN